MYKIYDISMPIREGMPVYKNKPEKQPKIHVLQSHDTGSVQESRVELDVHTGTHVDSPLHMVKDGDTMEGVPLTRLVGPCRVLELPQVNGGISQADLQGHDIQEGEFLLFKTRNSNEDVFNPEFVYLAEDGARYLAETGISGVGIDALGVERSQPGHPTHKALFAAGIVVIEGLRLAEVPAGRYFMVAAPIKLMDTEAAPARVMLLEGLV